MSILILGAVKENQAEDKGKDKMEKKHKGIKERKTRNNKRKKLIQYMSLFLVLLLACGGVALAGKKPEKKEKKKAVGTQAKNEKNKKKVQKKEGKKEDTRAKEFAVDPARPVGNPKATDEKVVYLTFDDGPSKLTEEILDILDEYDAKATFFVVGHEPDYAYMIKEAHKRGHTIGMHSYSHDYQKIYSSKEAYFKDLDKMAQVVKKQIGYVPCFIRFPGGSSNTASKHTPGIMTELVEDVQKKGYQYYDWNSGNWDGAVKTAGELIETGTSWTENNLLFLAHDSATKQTTVDSLRTIIEHYKDLGYKFRALDRQTITAHHPVNN